MVATAKAQDAEPRSYTNTPVGLNFLIAGYVYSQGKIAFDPQTSIANAQFHTDTEALAYVRSLDVAGKSAKFDVILPYSSFSAHALVDGLPKDRQMAGFGDPRFRFSINLFGAPALSVKDFANYQQDLIVGVSLQVSAPLGQYDNSKLLNLGNNRWSFRPELGVSKAWGPWTVEVAPSALFSHYLVNWSCESTRSVVLQRIFDDLRRALMPTECNPELFGFAPVEGREVVAAFDAGAITSDAGALLLGATDRAIGMMDRFASCFHDVRCPEFIEHEVVTLVGQRVFGIALGYEDLNDHDELRHDPLMAVLAGKLEARRQDCAPVAGKSTLNRLELSCLEPTRYHKISHNPVAIKGLFVDLFLEAHDRAPNQIILDLDATDDPVHGEQEGRFFHGYYDCYCYLPLYVFCGRDLLAAKLRRANIDAAAGSVEEVARIVAQIRRRWPCVRILLRADSGFAREELMVWCETNGVDFLFGLAKTDRLIAEIKAELEQAAVQSRRTGKPARRFKDFRWRTRTSWSRQRRVVAKAEWTEDEANPRFIVTSLTRAECKARYLYEKVYCARGDMENRIKECQLDLYADRTSTATMRANQLRLWFASMAYVLLCALRRIALHHTPFAKATCGTIRLKLLKIGALVRVSVRRIKVAMASACPAADAWGCAAKRLAAAANARASPA